MGNAKNKRLLLESYQMFILLFRSKHVKDGHRELSYNQARKKIKEGELWSKFKDKMEKKYGDKWFRLENAFTLMTVESGNSKKKRNVAKK